MDMYIKTTLDTDKTDKLVARVGSDNICYH